MARHDGMKSDAISQLPLVAEKAPCELERSRCLKMEKYKQGVHSPYQYTQHSRRRRRHSHASVHDSLSFRHFGSMKKIKLWEYSCKSCEYRQYAVRYCIDINLDHLHLLFSSVREHQGTYLYCERLAVVVSIAKMLKGELLSMLVAKTLALRQVLQ